MPSSRSTAALDGGPDLRGERHEPLARTGDEPDRDVDAAVGDADPDRVAAQRVAPGRSAAADAEDARDLERGEPDRVADDARADGQRGHQLPSRATTGSAASAAGVSVSIAASASSTSLAARGWPPWCGVVPGLRLGQRVRGERLGDPLGDPLAGGRGADPDRVLDHPPLRPAVGDDHRAPDAQQR